MYQNISHTEPIPTTQNKQDHQMNLKIMDVWIAFLIFTCVRIHKGCFEIVGMRLIQKHHQIRSIFFQTKVTDLFW